MMFFNDHNGDFWDAPQVSEVVDGRQTQHGGEEETGASTRAQAGHVSQAVRK